MRLLLVAGAGTAAVVVGAGLLAYAFRGTIGARLAVDYLARRGVPASIVIERLDPGGFTGSVRLGPPDDPDLTVERMEIEFGPFPLLRQGLAAPSVRNLRLVRPRLKGRYDGKTLSFGTLQPLIDEFLAQPVVTPGPNFRVEQGELRLATYAGPVLLAGEAAGENGRLRRAVGRLAATRLALGRDLTVQVAGADLDLQGQDDRLSSMVRADLSEVSGLLSLGATRLEAEASLPYGPQGFARLDGPLAASFSARSASAGVRGLQATRPVLNARISGDASGPMDALTVNLRGEGDVSADALTGPGGARAAQPSAAWKVARLDLSRRGDRTRLTGQGLTVLAKADSAARGGLVLVKASADIAFDRPEAEAQGARWSLNSPLKLKAGGRFDGATPAGRLSMPGLALTASGDAGLASDAPLRLTLAGAASSGQGGFDRRDAAGLAKALAALTDEARARAALSSFRISAPAWRLAVGPDGAEARLDRPAALVAAGGATATLSAAGRAPLIHVAASGAGEGGARLQFAGPGLPRLSVSAPAYRLSGEGRLAADLDLDGALDAAEIRGATLKGAGRLAAGPDGLAFTPRGCLQGSLAAFGPASAPLAENGAARLCAEGGRPLLSATKAGWRLNGRLEGGAARLAAAGVAAQDAALAFDLSGRDQSKGGRLALTGLRVADLQSKARFQPVLVAGDFALADDALTGRATVSHAAKGAALLVADVRQSAAGADGSAEIRSDLVFAKGGLQPADLSPLARGLASDVVATVRFAGRAAWTGKGLSSGGRLTTANAAFRSNYGPVTGVAADIVLDSLAPPTAAPGQTVSVEQIGWLIPLGEVKAVFGLTPDAVTVSEAEAVVAHGKASLGPITAPLAPGGTIDGTLRLENVDLGELVSKSSFADSVKLDARVNGALPFSVTPTGMRFANGVLTSIDGGRLSIKREALTGAVATAGAAGAQPNAVQDFAYQALENLAFDSLEARLESRPEGRLGAIFHLVGRNDPPGSPVARIGLLDALRGRAFDKPIPLPKATPIDLTLDTSLNFDELLDAYGSFGRGGSAAVQP